MSAPGSGMERPRSPASEHYREVAWAIFMMNVVVAALALVFIRHTGVTTAIWIYVVFGTIVTGALGGLLLLNVAVVRLYEAWRKRGPES